METGALIEKQPYRLPSNSRPINQMVDTLNTLRGLTFDQGAFDVATDQTGIRISLRYPAPSTGYPWGSIWPFGITVVGKGQLKVWNGQARRWGQGVYTAADTVVQFSGNGTQYVVWKLANNGAFSILTSPQVEPPVEQDTDAMYGTVARMNWESTSNRFTIVQWVQCGMIHCPIFVNPNP